MRKRPVIDSPKTDVQQTSIDIAKNNVKKQAAMAAVAVAVTLVLVFAMTVAWYSNVVHSEGLVFQASSWDFDFEGQVEFSKDQLQAAPGDSGIVAMSLENDSTEAISVLVNVSKTADISNDMKRRIYFYVDDNVIRNEEAVDRVYVNAYDEYGYTVPAGNTLSLNEEYHNAPYLKWEWVYDVLGYYVQGTMDASGKVAVEDYLRPVTYDYETATFDAEGNLLTVDGATTTKEFVESLYETDGYPGTTVPEPVGVGANQYYPVAVDEETKTGIWLHLCTKEEIQIETDFDTNLAKLLSDENTQGTVKPFTVRVLLSGQQAKESAIAVNTAQDLAEQLANTDIDKIEVNGNLTLTEKLTLPEGKNVVLNLNESTLTLPASGDGFSVPAGSTLTLMNGVLEGPGQKGTAILSTGGVVNLTDMEISNVLNCVAVRDDSVNSLDSRVHITDSKLTAHQAAVFVRGNGDISARKTSVLIENSTLISADWVAVAGNGTETASGTDMEIIKSTVQGKYAGIYLPQSQSVTIVKNSTITGNNGIVIKAGDLNVVDSTIQATGAKGTPAFGASGFTDTGDGIYIETNYQKPINVRVTATAEGLTNVLSKNASAVLSYEDVETATWVSIRLEGGIYSSDISKYVSEGYACTQLGDGRYEIGEAAASNP